MYDKSMKTDRPTQLSRQWALLRELMAHPAGRNWTELRKALRSQERTVYRDLATLRKAGFKIARGKIGSKIVWKLESAGLPPVQFTPAEIASLALAGQIIEGFHGSVFNAGIKQAFQKIRAMSDSEGLRVLEAVEKRFSAGIRRARPYGRQEIWFKMILDAVLQQKSIRIKYFTLTRSAESVREINPYGMVLYEGAFYVVGYCHTRREVRTFLLDRIKSVIMTGRGFVLPAGFSVKAYFKDSWGLLKSDPIRTVRIKFAREIAPVIREGRWHESQRIEDQPDGSVILGVKVAGMEEVRRWLIGFGSLAKVIEPDDLRGVLRQEGAAITRMYKGK
jgi:predicted DNA-binding transcriptional regulator YafY